MGRLLDSLRIPLAACAAAVLLLTPRPLDAQAGPPATAQDQPADAPPSHGVDIEPGRAVPVLLGGEPVVWISAGMGQYTPEARAARITERLEEIVAEQPDRGFRLQGTGVVSHR